MTINKRITGNEPTGGASAAGVAEPFTGRAVASWKKAAANMVAHWKANGPTVEAQWCTHAAQLLSMGSELMPDGVALPDGGQK